MRLAKRLCIARSFPMRLAERHNKKVSTPSGRRQCFTWTSSRMWRQTLCSASWRDQRFNFERAVPST